MHVSHLSLHDFRSYPEADVELGPGATAFIGRNGQGKTNLVEALGYLATLLRSVATLGYASTIYVLPVSLFGMAVSAAQLPEMSSAVGSQEASSKLRPRAPRRSGRPTLSNRLFSVARPAPRKTARIPT